MYLKRLWYSGNNMFGFNESDIGIQKYKNMQTDTLCVTLDYTKISQSLDRIQTRTRSQRLCGGFRRHRLFNRHLNVPWEQTGLIHLQTLFQLQVGVSVHEALDKILTELVSHV